MNAENEIMLLRENNIEPTSKVIESVLEKDIFEINIEILKIISDEPDLRSEWRFYKDGRAWLCKITCKKKTICWLSIYNKFLRTSFYFTGKNRSGINNLPIDGELKKVFGEVVAIGKLFPLVIDIIHKDQLKDFLEIVRYKKSLR